MKEELYKIFYKKYSIFANAYLSYVKVVKTADIYHEVGKLICTSLENIKNIWYGTMKDENAYKVSVAYWEENGYRKIDGTQTWVCEK